MCFFEFFPIFPWLWKKRKKPMEKLKKKTVFSKPSKHYSPQSQSVQMTPAKTFPSPKTWPCFPRETSMATQGASGCYHLSVHSQEPSQVLCPNSYKGA